MDQIWKEMYEAAKTVQNGRKISDDDTERIVTLGDLTPEWWI